MKKIIVGFFVLAAAGAALSVLLPAGLPAQQREAAKLKVYISADIEGVCGIVNAEQTSPGNPDYALARKWMVDDVNAAVDGAFRAGATEVVVNDSHGSMRNIDPGELHPKAILITGSPKPQSMMQGLDETYGAVLFIGYHAGAGTQDGVLDHTISGSVVQSVKVNGAELPELGLNGAVAGAYGVPVVFVSGDVAVCKQAKAILGGEVVTAPVKDGIGRYAARLVPFAEARRAIRDRVTEALRKASQIKPYRVATPCKFELQFYISAQADMAMYIPTVQRLNARTVAFQADDYVKGFRLLRALIALAPPR